MEIEITSVTVDMRKFSSTLLSETSKSPYAKQIFFSFINDYIKILIETAKQCVVHKDDLEIITTGDGIICIFKNHEYHNIQGFLFSIMAKKILEKEPYNKYNYGIGIDSGYATMQYLAGYTNYISSAINISSKTEKLTKNFISSEIIITNRTFEKIIDKLYADELEENGFKQYIDLRNETKIAEESYDEQTASKYRQVMNSINEKLFFRYLTKYKFDELLDFNILYGYSESLFRIHKNHFWEKNSNIIKKCINSNFIRNIQEVFN